MAKNTAVGVALPSLPLPGRHPETGVTGWTSRKDHSTAGAVASCLPAPQGEVCNEVALTCSTTPGAVARRYTAH